MKSVEKNRYFWGGSAIKARIKTELVQSVLNIWKVPSMYVHSTNASDLAVQDTNNNVKVVAWTTTHHPSAIIIKSIVSCPAESHIHLPKKHAKKAMIRRARVTKTKKPPRRQHRPSYSPRAFAHCGCCGVRAGGEVLQRRLFSAPRHGVVHENVGESRLLNNGRHVHKTSSDSCIQFSRRPETQQFQQCSVWWRRYRLCATSKWCTSF